jgi:hypothetical protein
VVEGLDLDPQEYQKRSELQALSAPQALSAHTKNWWLQIKGLLKTSQFSYSDAPLLTTDESFVHIGK